jgi:predicted RNase H-like HicB family nuclease
MAVDEIVFLVEQKEDGGFIASCSRWGIYTQGDDLDDLRRRVRDAVDCRFADESTRPGRVRLHFVRDEVIAG